MSATDLPAYDMIGLSYTRTRRADPRIVDVLAALLELPPNSVIADIGAGTGNYTCALADRGYQVQAVEPSAVMRGQASPHPNVYWHDGVAEQLPLADNSVQGCISTLAVHHFLDLRLALREMERVTGSGPLVFLTFDYRQIEPLWLADYFPQLWKDAIQSLPPLEEIAADIRDGTVRAVEISPFPLPLDLVDLFLAAGWQRPEVYLNPAVRAGISSFAAGDEAEITAGLARLQSDLNSGQWDTHYGQIRSLQEIDAGYRFLTATKK